MDGLSRRVGEREKKEKNKPQKTRKHTKPRCGKKKIMVWEGCDLCGYCFTFSRIEK